MPRSLPSSRVCAPPALPPRWAHPSVTAIATRRFRSARHASSISIAARSRSSSPPSPDRLVEYRIVVRADVDRPEPLLVALEVLVQRLQQPLGVARRRDHARSHLRAAIARLDERKVEHELVLRVIE